MIACVVQEAKNQNVWGYPVLYFFRSMLHSSSKALDYVTFMARQVIGEVHLFS